MKKKIMERCGRKRSIKESVCSIQINNSDAIAALDDLVEAFGYAEINQDMARALSTDELNDLIREISRDFDIDSMFGTSMGDSDDADTAFEEFENLCNQFGDSAVYNEMINILDTNILAENAEFICIQYGYDSPYAVEMCEEGLEIPREMSGGLDEFSEDEWPDPAYDDEDDDDYVMPSEEERAKSKEILSRCKRQLGLSDISEDVAGQEVAADPIKAKLSNIKKALGLTEAMRTRGSRTRLKESIDTDVEDMIQYFCKTYGYGSGIHEDMEFGSPISRSKKKEQKFIEDISLDQAAADLEAGIIPEESKGKCALCGTKINPAKDARIEGFGYLCPKCVKIAKKAAK